MCRQLNIAMCDYQESVTTGQTDRQTNTRTAGQTDAGQSDPYVPLYFAGDAKSSMTTHNACNKFDYTTIAYRHMTFSWGIIF